MIRHIRNTIANNMVARLVFCAYHSIIARSLSVHSICGQQRVLGSENKVGRVEWIVGSEFFLLDNSLYRKRNVQTLGGSWLESRGFIVVIKNRNTGYALVALRRLGKGLLTAIAEGRRYLLLMGSSNPGNYFHFVFEIVSTIAFYIEGEVPTNEMVVVYPKAIPESIKEAIVQLCTLYSIASVEVMHGRLEVARDYVILDSHVGMYSPYGLHNVFYANKYNLRCLFHMGRSVAKDLLAGCSSNIIGEQIESKNSHGIQRGHLKSKICYVITRSKGAYNARRCVNIEELIEQVPSHFLVKQIEICELSWIDQLKLVNAADLLIIEAGAFMSNIVFCHRSPFVVVLYQDSKFADVALVQQVMRFSRIRRWELIGGMPIWEIGGFVLKVPEVCVQPHDNYVIPSEKFRDALSE